MGDAITEADVRLFTTLVRFDAVYHGHFKCNRNKLTEMPNLWGYARDLFQTPGLRRRGRLRPDQEALLRRPHRHQPDPASCRRPRPVGLADPARSRLTPLSRSAVASAGWSSAGLGVASVWVGSESASGSASVPGWGRHPRRALPKRASPARRAVQRSRAR